VIQTFKSTGAELAVIIDEYGGVLGLVSLNDILEASSWRSSRLLAKRTRAIRREDGSWLFDGMIHIDELKDYLDIDELPDEDEAITKHSAAW
jgi:putative hemolysin